MITECNQIQGSGHTEYTPSSWPQYRGLGQNEKSKDRDRFVILLRGNRQTVLIAVFDGGNRILALSIFVHTIFRQFLVEISNVNCLVLGVLGSQTVHSAESRITLGAGARWPFKRRQSKDSFRNHFKWGQ